MIPLLHIFRMVKYNLFLLLFVSCVFDVVLDKNVISEKNKLFKDKFLDANHLLLTKLLELLKLPCAPLVTTTNQSSVDTNTSVHNGISQQQSSLQESSDTLNMSEQVIKTDGDTTQDESYMNNSQYSTVSQAGNSNEFKQPYKKGNIFKSTPSFGQDEVVLLCNEKTNVKSKKRRKAYKKQKSAAQFNNLNQSTDNNSDICISIKCESSSEQLSDSSVDYSFDNTPAHSSTAYGSNKKNNKPVKKFKQFRVVSLQQLVIHTIFFFVVTFFCISVFLLFSNSSSRSNDNMRAHLL
ncbi:Exosome component 10 [Schistosoma japonicum]|nr:Exosome component 10 [Schistosoma japonicum]